MRKQQNQRRIRRPLLRATNRNSTPGIPTSTNRANRQASHHTHDSKRHNRNDRVCRLRHVVNQSATVAIVSVPGMSQEASLRNQRCDCEGNTTAHRKSSTHVGGKA